MQGQSLAGKVAPAPEAARSAGVDTADMTGGNAALEEKAVMAVGGYDKRHAVNDKRTRNKH